MSNHELYHRLEMATLILHYVPPRDSLGTALRDIDTLGIRRIQIRAAAWEHVEQIVDAVASPGISLTAVVPLDGLPDVMALQLSHRLNLAVRIEPDTPLEHLMSLRSRVQVPICIKALSLAIDSQLDTLPLIQHLYETLGLPIVLEPELAILNPENAHALSWQALDTLYMGMMDLCRSSSERNAYLLSLGMLPTALLTEHPCNAYVCSGNHCHSKKSDLPRRLVVVPDGTLLPMHPQSSFDLALGNILHGTLQQLLLNYQNSSAHEVFRQITHQMFIDYVMPCPFHVIPWDVLFAYTSRQLEEVVVS